MQSVSEQAPAEADISAHQVMLPSPGADEVAEALPVDDIHDIAQEVTESLLRKGLPSS